MTAPYARLIQLPPHVVEQTTIMPSGCWIWTGYRNPRLGYGLTGHQGIGWHVHRLAYTLLVGPIPDDRPDLVHLCCRRERCPGGVDCPHRPCFNPDHLEPRTMRDRAKKKGEGFRPGSGLQGEPPPPRTPEEVSAARDHARRIGRQRAHAKKPSNR